MTIVRYTFAFILLIASLLACNSTYTSKKKGYFAIEFPEHTYHRFQNDSFPYSFDYPVYASISRDSAYQNQLPENDYWVNVDFQRFNAKIFLSYKKIGGTSTFKKKQANGTYKDSIGVNQFDLMVNDAFNLTNKNDVAASFINDSLMLTPQQLSGIYFKVGGNAATARQFFLSDTTHHFLRGALYFNATPNADSLKPVLDFLETDLRHIINTLKWKNAHP